MSRLDALMRGLSQTVLGTPRDTLWNLTAAMRAVAIVGALLCFVLRSHGEKFVYEEQRFMTGKDQSQVQQRRRDSFYTSVFNQQRRTLGSLYTKMLGSDSQTVDFRGLVIDGASNTLVVGDAGGDLGGQSVTAAGTDDACTVKFNSTGSLQSRRGHLEVV